MFKVLITVLLIAAFLRAQGGFEGPGRYEIVNLKSGKSLELDRNDQTSVLQFGSKGSDSQRWEVTAAAPGLFYIRNVINGKALEISRNANGAPLDCSPFDGGPRQQWRIDPAKDGNALITSKAGRTVDIPGGTSRDGVRIQIYDLNGESNQRFLFRKAGDVRSRTPEVRRHLDGDGACFYQQPAFNGDSVCVRAGDNISELRRDTRIWSVKIFGHVREVTLFERAGFGGSRLRVTRDEPDLSRMHASGRVGSVRVN
jgi:hypothetical protein